MWFNQKIALFSVQTCSVVHRCCAYTGVQDIKGGKWSWKLYRKLPSSVKKYDVTPFTFVKIKVRLMRELCSCMFLSVVRFRDLDWIIQGTRLSCALLLRSCFKEKMRILALWLTEREYSKETYLAGNAICISDSTSFELHTKAIPG